MMWKNTFFLWGCVTAGRMELQSSQVFVRMGEIELCIGFPVFFGVCRNDVSVFTKTHECVET